MILVVGATGLVGSVICQKLSASGQAIRALVRTTSDAAKVANLKALGAELVYGDVRDTASLRAAVSDVDAVIETVSAMPFSYSPGDNDIQHVDLAGSKALIDAAKAAGVKHYVYTSFTKKTIDFPLGSAKLAVEAYLQASGMVYTILRPGYFMELWLSPAVGFDVANAKAAVYGSGDQPISFISFKDVAGYAVESLTVPAARNAVLDLGGPESVSPHQAIALFAKKTGKTFEVNHVPAEALKAQMDGTEEPMQKSFSGLMYAFAVGDPIDMRLIRAAFKTHSTPLQEFIDG